MRMKRRLGLDCSAPRQARALLEPLRAEPVREGLEAVGLVMTELVANCVQHGGSGSGVTVELQTHGDSIKLSVTSPTGRGQPRLLEPGSRSDGGGGLGLHVVDALATAWGVEQHGSETTVWAELRGASAPDPDA